MLVHKNSCFFVTYPILSNNIDKNIRKYLIKKTNFYIQMLSLVREKCKNDLLMKNNAIINIYSRLQLFLWQGRET